MDTPNAARFSLSLTANCTRTLCWQGCQPRSKYQLKPQTAASKRRTAHCIQMKSTLFSIFLLFTSAYAAAEPPASTKLEIDNLFTQLKTSGCEFNRNGTWYSAAEATAHLNKKYDYLKQKNSISSTEDFIDNAASKSSVSGEPYFVKCKDTPRVESAKWFKEALTKYRQKL